MSNYYKFLILSGGLLLLTSCSNSSVDEQTKRIEFVFREAVNTKDWDVARMATYQLMSLDSNNKSYYDTLTHLYAITRDHQAAFLSGMKALEYSATYPTMRYTYTAANALGYHEDAITVGTTLLETYSDSLDLIYNLSLNYISTQQADKAESLLNMVVMHIQSKEYGRLEPVGEQFQKISYLACAYNSLGYIRQQANKLEEAQEMFNKALEVHPEYVLAKNNLLFVQRQLESVEETP